MAEVPTLDFSGLGDIGSLLQAARKANFEEGLARDNAETQRMFAENTARRESAQEYRDRKRFEQEDEDRKHARSVEQAQALPAILRAARNSAGLGNALGAPYGISFEQQAGGPSVAGSDLFHAANNAYGDFAKKQLATPEQSEESGEPAGHDEAAEGESPVEEATAKLASAKPKLMAKVGGQSFEVPESQQETGLGDKYDAHFKALVDRGIPEEKAMMAVLAESEKDANAQAQADRLEKSLGFRGEHALTAEQIAELKREQMAQSEKNARIGAEARLGAARLQAGPRQEAVDNAELGTYERVSKEAKSASGSSKDIAVLKNIEKIDDELNSNSPAAQNAAVDTLAQIAQGGKASIAVMNVFQKHSIGPVQAAADKLYQLTHNGQHSPEYIAAFKSAVKGLKQVATEQRTRAFEAHEEAAGRKSQFAQNPKLKPFVENARSAYRKELGLPEEAPTRKVRMPDGTVAEFDSAGNRVK